MNALANDNPSLFERVLDSYVNATYRHDGVIHVQRSGQVVRGPLADLDLPPPRYSLQPSSA